jgi:hypothetical protein
MSQWLMENLGPEVPSHFSAFHPDWKMMDKPRTPLSTLTRSRATALKNELGYVYTGNVHYMEGDSTYCRSSAALLMGGTGTNFLPDPGRRGPLPVLWHPLRRAFRRLARELWP